LCWNSGCVFRGQGLPFTEIKLLSRSRSGVCHTVSTHGSIHNRCRRFFRCFREQIKLVGEVRGNPLCNPPLRSPERMGHRVSQTGHARRLDLCDSVRFSRGRFCSRQPLGSRGEMARRLRRPSGAAGSARTITKTRREIRHAQKDSIRRGSVVMPAGSRTRL
jgi:hypothetical protein